MKLSACIRVLAALLAFPSFTASAGIIVASGNSFNDLGGSTIDLQTNLEWRDMHLTNGRSLCSVSQDIGATIPAGCGTFDGLDLINNAEGWRYATRAEVATLLTNWMGVPVPLNGSVVVDAGLNQQFRDVFADGSADIRPDFYPDNSNPIQSVAFDSSIDVARTDFFNGDINGSCCGQGSALVRETVVTVPEPGTLGMMSLALVGFGFARRRVG